MPPAQVTDALWHCLCPSFPRSIEPGLRASRTVRVRQYSARSNVAYRSGNDGLRRATRGLRGDGYDAALGQFGSCAKRHFTSSAKVQIPAGGAQSSTLRNKSPETRAGSHNGDPDEAAGGWQGLLAQEEELEHNGSRDTPISPVRQNRAFAEATSETGDSVVDASDMKQEYAHTHLFREDILDPVLNAEGMYTRSEEVDALVDDGLVARDSDPTDQLPSETDLRNPVINSGGMVPDNMGSQIQASTHTAGPTVVQNQESQAKDKSSMVQTVAATKASSQVLVNPQQQASQIEEAVSRSSTAWRNPALDPETSANRQYQNSEVSQNDQVWQTYGAEADATLQDLVDPSFFRHDAFERSTAIASKYESLEREELRTELMVSANDADHSGVRHIVDMLTKDLSEEYDIIHYQALILAQCNAKEGSAENVEGLLRDLEKAGVPADTEIYHAALKALSVHPDYLLRQEILDKMQQHWFPLRQDGRQWVIVGLIRDKQMEVALEKYQEMIALELTPDIWLLNLMIFSLTNMYEFAEALRFLEVRCLRTEPLPPSLWTYVLSTAAGQFDYDLTAFVWRKAVALQLISPSSGVCTDILSTAARHGDFQLATDVFRVLGQRSSDIELYHYEALLESYLAADDLKTALSVASIMESSSTPPNEGSMTSLYAYLIQDISHSQRMLHILRSQRSEEKPIAMVTVNTLLDAFGYHGALSEAMKIYNQLDKLIETGPTTSTFNTLIRACNMAHAKDEAMHLAKEMKQKGVNPNQLTYDRLILCCTSGENPEPEWIEMAYNYWEEMCSKGWWPRPGTIIQLLQYLTKQKDQKVWRILQANDRMFPGDGARLRQWVNSNWGREDVVRLPKGRMTKGTDEKSRSRRAKEEVQ